MGTGVDTHGRTTAEDGREGRAGIPAGAMTDFDWRGWQGEAERWIERQLREHGFDRPVNISRHHQRPWSFVMRASTAGQDFYFKAARPEFRHEVRVMAGLAQRWPESVPKVIGSDEERGWMLMPDGGERLREVATDGELPGHWRRLLPLYANMQRALIADQAWLMSLGVPDRRPQSLPGQLQALADDPLIVDETLPDGLLPAERRSWLDLLERLPELCETLTGFGIPPTLNHGDLHDGNIFFNGGHYQIFDWGDCSLAHPFFSIRTTFVSLENRLGWEEADLRFAPLKQAYLQAWIEMASLDTLREAFELASRLWSAGSLLSWFQALKPLDPAERQPYDSVLPSLARELTLAAR